VLQPGSEHVLSSKKLPFSFLRNLLAAKDCNGRAQIKNKKTKEERAVIKIIFSDDSLSRLARITRKGEQVQSFEANIIKIQYLRNSQILFYVGEFFQGEYKIRITYRNGQKSVDRLRQIWRDFLITGEEFDVLCRVSGITVSGRAILIYA